MQEREFQEDPSRVEGVEKEENSNESMAIIKLHLHTNYHRLKFNTFRQKYIIARCVDITICDTLNFKPLQVTLPSITLTAREEENLVIYSEIFFSIPSANFYENFPI